MPPILRIALTCVAFAFSILHIELRAQVIDTLCAGFINAAYTVEDHSGAKYYWMVKGGDIISGNGTSSIHVNWNDKPGLYLINVIEENEAGCQGAPVNAYVFLRGKTFNTNYPASACTNDSVLIIAEGGLRYLWDNGETDSILKIKLLHDTSMKVIISDTVCGNRTDTFPVNIKALSKPAASYNLDDEDVYLNQLIELNYMGRSTDKIIWLIQKANNSSSTAHGLNVRFIDTGEAYIKLISTNGNGCIDTNVRMINIKDEQLFFPNAFTPDNNQLNETFRPVGRNMKTFHMMIYNRWGQLIFETNQLEEGWDGKYKGEPVQQDNYVYKCEAEGNSKKQYVYSGNIAVIR